MSCFYSTQVDTSTHRFTSVIRGIPLNWFKSWTLDTADQCFHHPTHHIINGHLNPSINWQCILYSRQRVKWIRNRIVQFIKQWKSRVNNWNLASIGCILVSLIALYTIGIRLTQVIIGNIKRKRVAPIQIDITYFFWNQSRQLIVLQSQPFKVF